MKTTPLAVVAAIVLALVTPSVVLASSTLPLTTAEQITASDAVFRGKVVGITTARGSDGLIYTRTSLSVDEPLKGKFPQIVAVEHRGGQVGNEQEYFGLSPKLASGGEYLLFVTRDAAGKLRCTQGHVSAVPLQRTTSAIPGQPEFESPGQETLDETRAIIAAGHGGVGSDVSDQAGTSTILPMATTGMLGGINTRFLQPDRGEPIPYLIDATSLPAGITLSQATNAVQQALNAWSAVTSLKFKLESIGSFGQGADTITNANEKLRVQLHDNYNRINSPGTLGIGGRSAATSVTPAGWDIGGNVAGEEFRKSTYGYVVLEATNTAMQTLSTFAEVLCHELGHALNMAHSSEVFTTNSVLFNSIMYYQAHADGRGAALGVYDPPTIQQAYPSNNTPPYTYSRVLDITTDTPTQPNVPGINELELRGYDLQTTNLTLLTTNATANNGSFTKTGSTIKYTASGFSSGGRLDPAGGGFYDIIYARYSDGTNASPYATVRVISYNPDNFPSLVGDGIPDSWMTTHFGNPDPAAGPNRGAQQDNDLDGLKNIDEYRAGMIPTQASSGQRITLINLTNIQFQAKAYELYELHSSTNLINWVRSVNPIIPTTSTGTFSGFTSTAPSLFFRVQKVP